MKTTISIEEAFTRLEQIVAELDDEKLPLEKSIKLFEEGVSLIALCNDKLGSAKLKIEKLSTKLNSAEQLLED